MADLPPSPDRSDDAGNGSRPGAPRWVKLFGIIAVVVILLIVVLLLSGGNHGPGRHGSSPGGGGQTL